MPFKKIKKDGKTFYEVTASITRDGKRRQRKCQKSKTEREARKRQLELVSELEESFQLTVGNWVDEWLEKAYLSRKNGTVASYVGSFRRHLNKEFRLLPLRAVNQSHIYSIVFNPHVDIKPKSRANLHQMLRVVFRDALHEQLIPFNPCEGIKVEVPKEKLAAWTLSEVNHMLAEAGKQEHNWFCHWVMAVFTGMRSGELYALKPENVDLENKRIYVVSNWTNKDGYHETKGKKTRVVPISTTLYPFLEELLCLRGKEEYLLPHYSMWSKGQQAKVLRTFGKSLGLRQVNFHSLRATFITTCLLQGVSPVKVQHIVGHEDLKTTMRYVRLVGSDLDGALDDLGIVVPGAEPKVPENEEEIPPAVAMKAELEQIDAKVLALKQKALSSSSEVRAVEIPKVNIAEVIPMRNASLVAARGSHLA